MEKIFKLLRELSPAIFVLLTVIGGIALAEMCFFPGALPEWVGQIWLIVSLVLGGVLVVAHSRA